MMDDLTPDQRLAEAIRVLRDPVESDARAFDARVLAQLEHRTHANRRAMLWTVTAVLAACLVIGVALSYRSRSVLSPRATAFAEGTQIVRFRLADIHAQSVAIAGSFNRWNPNATPLHRAPDGSWTADVALTPGRHVYQFVIDQSRWIPDPRSPRDPGDDFGAPNSVITVLAHRRGS